MSKNDEYVNEARQLKAELRDMYIPRVANVEVASNNDNQRLVDWQARVDELERKNSVKINPELKRIYDEIDRINPQVFNGDKISYLIDSIAESERREYYEELYNFLLNHLLTYGVLYRGYYQANTKDFNEFSLVFEQISFKQPITKKIPIFNELVKSPYLIIEN
jgi:hypothetical protein